MVRDNTVQTFRPNALATNIWTECLIRFELTEELLNVTPENHAGFGSIRVPSLP